MDEPACQAIETAPSRAPSFRAHLGARLASMHPGYFALVMATGIVSIACRIFGIDEMADALWLTNLIAYPLLWVLLIARAVLFPSRFASDLSDHGRAPGFFTVVAATGVVGSQALVLHNAAWLASSLWWLCVVLWSVCTYTIFALLTIKKQKPSLEDGINGGWLIAVVATQSVCVLGCALNGDLLDDRDTVLFALMAFWLGGGMLYFWIIGLIFYRYLFFPFSPKDLMPPYWINMGAVAISTLAGASLATAASSSPLLSPLRPFILGLTVMFWATATWWIPMLVVLGFWRHVVRKLPVTYDPLYWGLVFPVGMYSVCTVRLSEALGADSLLWIARVFVVAATAVWLLTFLGLSRRLLYAFLLGLRGPSRPSPESTAQFQPQPETYENGY